jgi:acetyl-CoA acyltransferase
MREVFVIGVGMTHFGVHPEKTVGDMAREAVLAALADAGATVKDIGFTAFANTAQGALDGQFGIKGQHALRPIGVEGSPFINVENACTGSSVALNLAFMQVAGGFADVALAVGSEKLYTEDRAKRLSLFSQPLDLQGVQAFVDRYAPLVEDVKPPPEAVIDEAMRSPFMDSYAINAKLHMKRYGSTWRQLAAVSAKNHYHSTMNPLAQYQKDMSVEKVLGARIISWPLTIPMCAPVSDGGSAVIICSREALPRFAAKRAVKILGSAHKAGTMRDIADVENAALRLTAKAAYAQAGLLPKDISVAEVHDASAFGEVNQIEMVGLCEFGKGGLLAEEGATRLGGRIPVNVSGGLESRGHPVAATGLAQIAELVHQLRGEAGARAVDGARYGLAACSGGFMGVEDVACCVTILGRAN